MRTVLFLVAGFLLLAASFLLGRLFSSNFPNAPLVAVIVFAVLWFVIAGVNMWIGVTNAGYSIGEEIPVFALIFFVPVVVAALLKWRGL
jgi:hypothetical protein